MRFVFCFLFLTTCFISHSQKLKLEPSVLAECEIILPGWKVDSVEHLNLLKQHVGIPLTQIKYKGKKNKVDLILEGTFIFDEAYSPDSSIVDQILSITFEAYDYAMWTVGLQTTNQTKIYLSDCLHDLLKE